jgi:hypothetical protein
VSDSDQNQPSLPTPSDIANDRVPEFQVAEREKSWVEREMERREKSNQGGETDSDQNDLEKARILPIEERDRGGRGR